MATKKQPVTEVKPAEGGLSLEEPVVSDEFAGIPTVDEARAMFAERADLAQVATVEGVLNRDGSFAGERVLTLSGVYVSA